jgi:AraC-like DNA-binding protein
MENTVKAKYLIANKQDVLWGLIVNNVGSQSIEPGMPYPSANHPGRYLFSTKHGRKLNEYQLVYISGGKGYFMSAKQRRTEIQEGYMFLLFPGEWHNYAPDKERGWFESWIGFNGIDIDNKVSAGFFNKQQPIFNVGVNDYILNLYKLAVKTATEQNTGFQQILGGIVNLLLGFTYSGHKQVGFEHLKITNQINTAKIIMQENMLSGITCQQIAQNTGMSYSWFRRIFKQYTGFAPGDYIQELKVNKAKELLTNTMLNCKEIAFDLDFETPAYFNIVFKKKTGITPNKYRKLTQDRNISKIS